MYFNPDFFILVLICNVWHATGKDDWWEHTTIYEVFIPSFKDSDGDGVGDIKGLTSMLDHFVDLEIDTIQISPVYKQPMADFGYDVEDFYDVDPVYGTMEDFEELLSELERLGMKLIMDFILNHSSDKHPWFLKSVNKTEPYTDYYVWRNPNHYNEHGIAIPPNNWLSVSGDSAWKWNVKRKQFYYHVFGEHQPDFNLRDSRLFAELKNATKFWLEKGVSGICLETPGVYMEDTQFRNEPVPEWKFNGTYLELPDSYHEYTHDLNASFEFINKLREYVDYQFDMSQKVIISGGRSSWKNTMKYYGKEDYKVTHFPHNFILTSVTPFPTSRMLYNLINDWFRKMPEYGVANWKAENQYNENRIGSRLSAEYMDIMMILVMTLPGIASIRYGQEIGMMNTKLRPDQVQDKLWHDSARSPMQWDDSMNAGFSSNSKSWLPVNSDYWQVNVETQKKLGTSRYKLCSILSAYRRERTLKYGDFKPYLISPWIYAFTRQNTDFNDAKQFIILVIINTGSETEIVPLHTSLPHLPPYMKVIATSMNAGYERGTKIYTNPKFSHSFIMRPASALVLSSN